MRFSLIIIFLFMFSVSGCAGYKYLYDVKPYKEGYVISRNDTVIVEYTIGRDNIAPQDLKLAKERFRRRKAKVEYYYKKMDILYWPVASAISYPRAIVGVVLGVFKVPFILVSNYRYGHNPEYKNKVDRIDAEKKLKEDKDKEVWRAKLVGFIKQDLEKEESYVNK